MNYEYSVTMKKLMKKKPGIFMHVACITLMSILLALSILSFLSERKAVYHQKKHIQVFDSFSHKQDYSSMTAVILSQQFAVSDDKSKCYCIAYDDKYQPHIVALSIEQVKKQYQDLIDYTYSDMVRAPSELVVMEGIPHKMGKELISMAMEAYKTFSNRNDMDNKTFRAVFGTYYLDTTQVPKENYTVMICALFLCLLLGVSYYLAVKFNRSEDQNRQATLDTFDEEELQVIDQELNYPTTVDFNRQKLYFTRNYIVSAHNGLQIIPMEDMVHVYGLEYYQNAKCIQKSIVIETRDEKKHEITTVSMKNEGEFLYDQIVERMKLRLPNVCYGMENGSFARKVDMDVIDALESMNNKSEKVSIKGILGAILGAALGGAIWIFLGRMEFIAGIAGVFIIFFAIEGYSRMNGFFDQKGFIASVTVSFFMILAANYILYKLTLYKYYYSDTYELVNIIKSWNKLPDLVLTDYWNGFCQNLIIGYVLSICTSIGIHIFVVERS